MDFVQLLSYVTAVECGSFSSAAKKLHMAHSTVTGHVQRLEQEFDCQLLRRSTRTMAVTEKGHIFYRYAKQLLGVQGDLQKALDRAGGPETIAIASICAVNFGLLPQLLANYRAKNSAVCFDLQQGQAPEILTSLFADGADVCFVDEECANRDVVCTLLGRSRRKLLVPRRPEFEAIDGEDFDTGSLPFKYPYICSKRDRGRLFEQDWAETETPGAAVSASDTQNIINSVRAGLGVAAAPGYVAKRLADDPGIRVFSGAKCPLPVEPVYLVFRKGETNREVLDFCRYVQRWAKDNRSAEDIADYT
ncbi:MAG: LysR family transcriptional regulator [Oscillospiraceae bacterium]